MKKIVIVDDEADIGFILSYELKELGFELKVCLSGEEALDCISTSDIVLCDFKMPKMDGLQVLLELKKRGIDTNFFILTGEPTMNVEDLLKHGVTKVLFKPDDIFKIKDIFKSLQD